MLEEIGVPEQDAVPGARLLEIMMDEDATYWFTPGVERRLGIRIPMAEWERVATVGEAVERLLECITVPVGRP